MTEFGPVCSSCGCTIVYQEGQGATKCANCNQDPRGHNVQDFTYRNLARVVFDSFAISTTELANEFGVSNHRILKALKRYPAIFCGDSYEESGGVTSRQGHREGGGYGAILWQCWKTYDDHQIDEVYQDLANEGVELDAVIGGKNAGS